VQSDINLTGHITDALLTIVGGPTWERWTRRPRGADAGHCRTPRSARPTDHHARGELADWFREQGVNVHEVDRGPFIEAVKALHNGDMATWDQATYDRLQAIQ
jgi:hypothetical protein